MPSALRLVIDAVGLCQGFDLNNGHLSIIGPADGGRKALVPEKPAGPEKAGGVADVGRGAHALRKRVPTIGWPQSIDIARLTEQWKTDLA